jgi:hypothetical protein
MISNVAHFVWMGRKLPFFAGLAIRSAALRGEFDVIIPYHTDPLDEEPRFAHVFDLPRVERLLLDPEDLLAPLARPELATGYRALAIPANRSDILRAALLYRFGGVYLDTDVIVLRGFGSVLGPSMLLGRNRSGYDFRSMTASWARMIWLRFKSALRAAVSRLPGGHQLFRGIQGLYPTHLTTGIWGSTAEHPLLARVLDRTAEVLRTTTSAGQGRIRRPRARCSAAGARRL